jgi:hypothetical protein
VSVLSLLPFPVQRQARRVERRVWRWRHKVRLVWQVLANDEPLPRPVTSFVVRDEVVPPGRRAMFPTPIRLYAKDSMTLEVGPLDLGRKIRIEPGR